MRCGNEKRGKAPKLKGTLPFQVNQAGGVNEGDR